MASKFLTEDEFEIIAKICESKGLPKFHLIAFNDEAEVPEYKMASGYYGWKDLFTFKVIFEVVLQQVQVMCDILEKGGNPIEDAKENN